MRSSRHYKTHMHRHAYCVAPNPTDIIAKLAYAAMDTETRVWVADNMEAGY